VENEPPPKTPPGVDDFVEAADCCFEANRPPALGLFGTAAADIPEMVFADIVVVFCSEPNGALGLELVDAVGD
jgi:hypothetical protein